MYSSAIIAVIAAFMLFSKGQEYKPCDLIQEYGPIDVCVNSTFVETCYGSIGTERRQCPESTPLCDLETGSCVEATTTTTRASTLILNSEPTTTVTSEPTTTVTSEPTTTVTSAPTTAVTSAPTTAVTSAPTTTATSAPTTTVTSASTTTVTSASTTTVTSASTTTVTSTSTSTPTSTPSSESTTTPVPQPNPRCPITGRYFPHPLLCIAYYDCKTGNGSTVFCPIGTVFNSKAEPPCVPFTWSPTPNCYWFRCFGKNGLSVPYLPDPQVYARCNFSIAVRVELCPAGAVFTEATQACATAPTSTPRPPRPPTPTCPTDDRSYPHLTRCNAYYDCTAGDGPAVPCPRGSVFDPKNSASPCVPYTSRPASNCYRFGCYRKQERLVPYPGDSRIYARCRNNMAVESKICQSGQQFNATQQKCI